MCKCHFAYALADTESQQDGQVPEASIRDSAQAMPSSSPTTQHVATESKASRSTRSAQQDSEVKAVHQFPSPPKTRTRGGKRAQTARDGPAAAAKPPRTRRGAKKAAAADTAPEHAEPAQSSQAPQDVAPASGEAGTAENRASNATSPHAEASPSLQPDRHVTPDDSAEPAAVSNSMQHAVSTADQETRSPSASLQVAPPTSLVSSSKRKESPNALSPVLKRRHQEPSSTQQAETHAAEANGAQGVSASNAKQTSQLLIGDSSALPQASDIYVDIGPDDDNIQRDPHLVAGRADSQSLAHSVSEAVPSTAEDNVLPPDASPVQLEQVASISDSEPDDAADSTPQTSQRHSPTLQNPSACKSHVTADASISSPHAASQCAVQRTKGNSRETAKSESSANEDAADCTLQLAPADVDLMHNSQQPSLPVAVVVGPAPVQQAAEGAAADHDGNHAAAETAQDDVLAAASAVMLPAVSDAEPAKQAQSSASGTAPEASAGLGKNLVSAIRSFLPGSKAPEPQLAAGKKPVKVCSLLSAFACLLHL